MANYIKENEANIQVKYSYEDEVYYFEARDNKTTACKTFAEALANLVNIYFEDFIDEEIEEIKEILENDR